MRFKLRCNRAALIATATTMFAAPTMSAQDTIITRQRVPSTGLIWTRAADRAVLGVTLAAASRADTAVVRIEDVELTERCDEFARWGMERPW